jgi:hypothetical protein
MRNRDWLCVLALGAAGLTIACSPEAPAVPLAGAELRVRAEARIAREHESLRSSLGHLGLVGEVKQEDVARNIARVRLRRDGVDIVMGSLYGIELHGGGVLALLLRYWRPEGRPATLEDRYPFSGATAPVALSVVYAAHRNQVFLPVGGRERESIQGDLPAHWTLPRMRFEYAPAQRLEVVEADAFAFLLLLTEQERNLDSKWTNRLGQRLSARLLLDNTWDYYIAPRDTAFVGRDHGELHLVELLLAYQCRDDVPREPNEIKRAFLASELARRKFPDDLRTEALGHTLDSLGRLLDDSDVTWGRAEKDAVRRWLQWLEDEMLPNMDEMPIQHLTHVVSGLRSVARNEPKLN